MVGWHHQFNGHEFEQTLGDSEGQGSLISCSPWGCKELDTTELLHFHFSLSHIGPPCPDVRPLPTVIESEFLGWAWGTDSFQTS